MPRTVKVKGLDRPLEFPDEMDDFAVLRVLREKFSRFAEPALAIGSGAIAEPVAGLAGIAQSLNPWADEGAGARAVESVQNALTIGPFTKEGEQGLADFGKAVMDLPVLGDALKTFEEAQVAAGEKGLEEGGPLLGALSKGAVGILPDLLGLKYLKTAKNLSQADLGTTRMFGGIAAKNADKPALAKAKQLAESGANRDEIWKETGWYNDAGDWKFEIDDSGSRFDASEAKEWKAPTGDYSYKYDDVQNIVEHKGLFENYPDEGVMNLRLDQMSAKGQFDPNNGIMINKGMLDDSDKLSTSLHEIQHAIQTKEGFQGGGNIRELERLGKIKNKDITAFENVLNNRMNSLRNDKYYRDLQSELMESAEARDVDKMMEVSNKQNKYLNDDSVVKQYKKDLHKMYGDNPQISYYDQYQRLAGEAEARNVQTRLDWTPEQRRITPPWESLDVPESELIRR